MKPFKTYRQQIAVLRKRGVIINNGSLAMRVLESENYYCLINGYKDLFLDNTTNHTLEKYKNGTAFEEIYKLYCFDRDLRNILIEYLLKFESIIKSIIAYRFSEKFKQPNAYLQLSNFSNNQNKLTQTVKLISIITNVISKNAHAKYPNPIKHYLDKHSDVPLWVLVNYLTIGNIHNFYDCIDNNLQNIISKDIAMMFKREYNTLHHITSEDLCSILKAANFFRNVCAHEERLYNFTIHKAPKSNNISHHLNIPTYLLEKGNVFTIFAFLKLVLRKKEHKQLFKKINNLFAEYKNCFHTVQFSDISYKMGFQHDWKSYFN